jgi:hypothetical protein
MVLVELPSHGASQVSGRNLAHLADGAAFEVRQNCNALRLRGEVHHPDTKTPGNHDLECGSAGCRPCAINPRRFAHFQKPGTDSTQLYYDMQETQSGNPCWANPPINRTKLLNKPDCGV